MHICIYTYYTLFELVHKNCVGFFFFESSLFAQCFNVLLFSGRWGGRWCWSGGPQDLRAYPLTRLPGRASEVLPRTVQWKHQRSQNGSRVFQGELDGFFSAFSNVSWYRVFFIMQCKLKNKMLICAWSQVFYRI